MNYVELILKNTSLWEIMALIIVIYVLFNPSLLKTITKLKVGDLEIELNALKEQVKKGEEHINELEAELENERRLFEDLIDNFDPDTPLKELSKVRQSIKTQAKNLEEIDFLKKSLTMTTPSEELYIAAVSIRERRPTALIPDLINFLEELSEDKSLGDFRLNTIWTLTSALHLSLLSAIRDNVPPMPNSKVLLHAKRVLDKLEKNPRVQNDRPDNPMKGIRGPIKHCKTWIEKGLTKQNEDQKV